MITDLDPLFTRTLSHTERASGSALHARRFSRSHRAVAFQSRADHEAAFERTHGSLWSPGLLDRLSLPLSRIHE